MYWNPGAIVFWALGASIGFLVNGGIGALVGFVVTSSLLPLAMYI